MSVMTFRPDAKLKSKFYLMTLLFGGLWVLPCAAFGFFLGSDVGGASGATAGVAISLVLNALWLLPVFLVIGPYCNSLCYEIHEDEVIVRVGIITKSVKHVPFRTVTNIKVSQGPFDRIFGLGTLHVETAGMSGTQRSEQSLIGLIDHQGVYEMVAAAMPVPSPRF
jgi:membrane protein YdbS with pleckstrin-like domain